MAHRSAIDLNLDAGENPESFKSGLEARLYRLVSSVNIACGGHAGDEETMEAAGSLAIENGLAVGAHPSYPDKASFGRKAITIPQDELTKTLVSQIRELRAICQKHGVRLGHVKPHGALYNVAASDADTASAIVEAVREVDATMTVVGLAGSQLLQRARDRGLTAAGEAFVDRRYEKNGTLRSRSLSDALLTGREAVDQALRLARGEEISSADGSPLVVRAETLCIHGDHNESLLTASAVREALEAAGFIIGPLSLALRL